MSALDDETVPFLLSGGDRCLIDRVDMDLLSRSWRRDGSGYARADCSSNNKPAYFLLHRVIAERIFGRLPDGITTDHRNGNKLDNRRSNLRPATSSQQQQNGPARGVVPYKGVRFDTSGRTRKPYRASIKVGEKRRHIGRFLTAEEAARAYDTEALTCFGAFARINFPAVQS